MFCVLFFSEFDWRVYFHVNYFQFTLTQQQLTLLMCLDQPYHPLVVKCTNLMMHASNALCSKETLAHGAHHMPPPTKINVTRQTGNAVLRNEFVFMTTY